jgi:ABC-2 type transport system ATP-binding protein
MNSVTPTAENASTVPALQTINLGKKFKEFQALHPLDLTIAAGEMVVLQGHNGSGKTTLLNCISYLIPPSSGEVKVAGFDMRQEELQARKQLVFVPDVPRFFLELTAWEHLRFIAAANESLEGFEQRAEKLLRDFNLWHVRDHFPHRFSRGMRLKLGLLLGLIRPSSVLLLDEPTSALDQEGTQLLTEELQRRKSEGSAILLSSHDATLADRLADRKIVLSEGRVGSIPVANRRR